MLDTTTIFILGSIALFLIGTLGGWVLTKLRKECTSPPIQTAIAFLITTVWVVAVAAEIVVPAYTVSMMLHGIMGAVVGYLFSDDGIVINIGSE
ncbi:MAG: hypothetical protein J07AB43_00840 [Candidatus Nanosalina sp. J07AB43]|jgi:hypothetical protein|nr:MAG: hypothetical protein J07AB43_00840 [Candidatus Nanosalina sp. J07AB43]